MAYLHGIDISAYQGEIDWEVVRRKVHFIYFRAAKGKDPDIRLMRNVIEAKRTGIPWGLYFVVKPDKSWIEQASYHADLYKEFPCPLPPACDFELTGGLNKGALLAWVTKYLAGAKGGQGFEQLTGKEMIIYTSAGFMDRVELSGSDGLWRRKLWVAHWRVNKPDVPAEWENHNKTWTFWQYDADPNGKAREYGAPPPPLADPDIDLDWYAGDEAKFEQEFGVKPNDPEAHGPIPIPVVVKVIGNKTNIRNAPVVDKNTDVGDLTAGAVLPVLGKEGEWYKVGLYVHESVVR